MTEERKAHRENGVTSDKLASKEKMADLARRDHLETLVHLAKTVLQETQAPPDQLELPAPRATLVNKARADRPDHKDLRAGTARKELTVWLALRVHGVTVARVVTVAMRARKEARVTTARSVFLALTDMTENRVTPVLMANMVTMAKSARRAMPVPLDKMETRVPRDSTVFLAMLDRRELMVLAVPRADSERRAPLESKERKDYWAEMACLALVEQAATLDHWVLLDRKDTPEKRAQWDLLAQLVPRDLEDLVVPLVRRATKETPATLDLQAAMARREMVAREDTQANKEPKALGDKTVRRDMAVFQALLVHMVFLVIQVWLDPKAWVATRVT